MMLEDLILRFHLKDYQVWLFAVTFWVFYDAFISGTIFGTGTFLGIDLLWFAVLIGWGVFLLTPGLRSLLKSARFQEKEITSEEIEVKGGTIV